MTHKALCIVAERIMRRMGHQGNDPVHSFGLSISVTAIEPKMEWENPDVIGWNRYSWGSKKSHPFPGSIVFECKVSHADFLADMEKAARQDNFSGMGDLRYYVCPPGIIKPEEVPGRWGLIYATPKGRSIEWDVIKGCRKWTTIEDWNFGYVNKAAEMEILLGLLGKERR